MNYSIVAVPIFKKELNRLAKKYVSLKSDLGALFEILEVDPTLGIPLGNNCYKIRPAISSKGKGKSGGARIITNFFIADRTVYLLSIFDKSEKDSLTDKELNELLKDIPG